MARFFSLKNFSLLIKPSKKKYSNISCCSKSENGGFCWQMKFDGVIFYLRPLTELENTIKKMQEKQKLMSHAN